MSLPFPTNPREYPRHLFRDTATGNLILTPVSLSALTDGTPVINLFVFNFTPNLFDENNLPALQITLPLSEFNDSNYYCVGTIESIISFVTELKNIKDRAFILNTFPNINAETEPSV